MSEWELRPKTRLKFAAGLQRQAPTIDHTFYALRPGTQLVPGRARTLEGGLEHRFGSAWRAAGTVYHRKDDDGYRFRDAEFRIVNNLVVRPSNPHLEKTISGDTRGVELVLERRSANGLTGWLSYAWNKSMLTDTGGDNGLSETFPFDDATGVRADGEAVSAATGRRDTD